MSALLPVRAVEKPWGRAHLPAPFAVPAGGQIGEVWFEPPPALPQILVKYIFTSQALSVQVHPSEADLPGQGKEECWLVIAAEPGARLGIGFAHALDREAMRAAALDGSIEHLLEWHAVSAGDFFHIPPGTVHAIGAGISLVEVQQNSDVTYRLYDYGRPRALHLDAALAVAHGAPHPPALRRHLEGSGSAVLVAGPHFRLERIEGQPGPEMLARFGDAPLLVIPRLGTARVAGEAVLPGQCALAPSLAALEQSPIGQVLAAQPCTA